MFQIYVQEHQPTLADANSWNCYLICQKDFIKTSLKELSITPKKIYSITSYTPSNFLTFCFRLHVYRTRTLLVYFYTQYSTIHCKYWYFIFEDIAVYLPLLTPQSLKITGVFIKKYVFFVWWHFFVNIPIWIQALSIYEKYTLLNNTKPITGIIYLCRCIN